MFTALYVALALVLSLATYRNCRNNPSVSLGTLVGGVGFIAFGAAINALVSETQLPLGKFFLFEASRLTYATFSYAIGTGLFVGSLVARLSRLIHKA